MVSNSSMSCFPDEVATFQMQRLSLLVSSLLCLGNFSEHNPGLYLRKCRKNFVKFELLFDCCSDFMYFFKINQLYCLSVWDYLGLLFVMWIGFGY